MKHKTNPRKIAGGVMIAIAMIIGIIFFAPGIQSISGWGNCEDTTATDSEGHDITIAACSNLPAPRELAENGTIELRCVCQPFRDGACELYLDSTQCTIDGCNGQKVATFPSGSLTDYPNYVLDHAATATCWGKNGAAFTQSDLVITSLSGPDPDPDPNPDPDPEPEPDPGEDPFDINPNDRDDMRLMMGSLAGIIGIAGAVLVFKK